MSPGSRAAVLSFLFPGLGQIYLGLVSRAVTWFVGLVLLIAISGEATEPEWARPALAFALAVLSAGDAYLMAPRRPAAGGE